MENAEGVIHLADLIPYGKITEDVVLFIQRSTNICPETLAVQVNFYMQKIDPVQTIAMYKKTQHYTLIETQNDNEFYNFLLSKKFTSTQLAMMLMNFSDVLEKRKDKQLHY